MRSCNLFVYLVLIVLSLPLSAQDLEWLAGLDGFLDNREYYNTVQNPQTIFGSRFRIELGGSYEQIHRLRAGINYMYEFGSKIDAIKPGVTLYYQLDYEPVTFYMGAFPRRDLLDYPLALLTDTLNYYRPNVEGLYLRYNTDRGHENVFIDWTSRQTDFDYERFMFGFSGRLYWNMLFTTHHFLMGHFAAPGIRPADFHLRDNGGFDLNIGVDFSRKTILDSLWISTGAMVSLDRTRGIDEGWQTPAGFLVQGMAFLRGIGLQGTFYAGEGHQFLYGDSFYKAKSYGRLDLFYHPFNLKNVSGKLKLSIHFIEGTVDYSQQVLIYIKIGGSRPLKTF